MFSFKEKLKKGLKFTHKSITEKIKTLFSGSNKDLDQLYDEMEEILIRADVGITTTTTLIHKLKKEKKSKEEIYDSLKENLYNMLPDESHDKIEDKKVILVIGVNGTGKTTSIAKLAYHLKKHGKNVFIAAADTFRAAAVEQMEIWAHRLDIPLIKDQEGTDPSSVVFDAMTKAFSEKNSILIVDTAGRLHTKKNLLEELKKIKRTITKRIDTKELEIILLLDAITGTNSLEQAKVFSKEIETQSVFLSKLDSSAKGGFVFSIAHELKIPVRFIGVGETYEDMIVFSKKDFIETLFE